MLLDKKLEKKKKTLVYFRIRMSKSEIHVVYCNLCKNNCFSESKPINYRFTPYAYMS